jgi:hypothetical protein
MTAQSERSVDVLMCVGSRDVDYLMPFSLKACLRNFTLLNNVVIVTCAKPAVLAALVDEGLRPSSRGITVLEDDDVLPERLHGWPGWYKQQVIKLHADRICSTPVVACLGADTILLRPLTRDHLFSGPTPILYYNRYPNTSVHLAYERQRVGNVARILQVEPVRSLSLGDFIMDLMLFETDRLVALRQHLSRLYGEGAFLRVLPKRCDTPEQKVAFGEWTLYAVFLLDVLGARVPIRNSRNRFIAQVHSERDFARFDFGAHVVHFVDKTLDRAKILAAMGEGRDP